MQQIICSVRRRSAEIITAIFASQSTILLLQSIFPSFDRKIASSLKEGAILDSQMLPLIFSFE